MVASSPEKLEYARQYRNEHPETLRNWRKNNKEKYNHYQREYYMKNKNKFKDATMTYYQKLRKQVLDILGGKCKACGADDWRILQINHLNGGGSKELNQSPYRMYRAIVNSERNTDDLDCRCANCNILYEYETGRRGNVLVHKK